MIQIHIILVEITTRGDLGHIYQGMVCVIQSHIVLVDITTRGELGHISGDGLCNTESYSTS